MTTRPTILQQAAVAASVALLALSATETGLAAQAKLNSKKADLKVSANVVRNCALTVTDVNFGNYDPVGVNATTPATANGSVRLSCTRGTIATIALGWGQNATGNTRQMTGPNTTRLGYGLYKDAGHILLWGTSTGESLVLPAAPSVAERAFTVYGRLPGGQGVPAGAYNDVVVVNVSF